MSYVLKCYRERDLKGALLSLAEKVTQMVTDAQCSLESVVHSEEARDILKGQIAELWKESHPVRLITGESLNRIIFILLLKTYF